MQFGYVPRNVIAAIFLLFLINSCRETDKTGEAHAFTNALINETSPYLLQHAHNPVDWRPWSQEALEEAKETGKLVLVSIGYSSCHWCHVMEEETFEDASVAALMNKEFINIKVDREERPDVDQVYMTALQLLTGSGGWPLNVITLPNGKPIYGGTYHTKEAWLKVLREISSLYKEAPEKAEEYADKVAQGIQSANLIQPPSNGESLTREVLHSSVAFWKTKWDMELGGNQGTQKFMLPGSLDFLLDYAALTGDTTATTFVKTTLDQMARGGVYDQLGGGFFRYSTDPSWHIPHFEKMLYDNAQLIGLYSKAYTVFGDAEYQQLVQEITAFLDREMKHPGGAYYAAMDADSEGEEGAYYVWSQEELQQLLGERFSLFAAYYDIRTGQEWEQDSFVLRRPVPDDHFINEHGLSREQLETEKQNWKRILLAKRQERPVPRIDDKILTSWNALLVKGWVEAYEAFGDQTYLDRALTVYRFLQDHNRDGKKLRHSYKENSKQLDGFLEDYAFLAAAGLGLYSATGDVGYFEFSESLVAATEALFSDAASGMYRFREDDELIARIIKTDDGVLPSPNAVMAHVLFRIGHIRYHPESLKKSADMLAAITPYMQQSPDTYTKWGGLFLHTVYPFYEVAIAGPEALSLLRELKQVHLPNTLILASAEESSSPLFLNRYVPGQTYIYVCQNHSCKLPVTSVEAAVNQLTYP